MDDHRRVRPQPLDHLRRRQNTAVAIDLQPPDEPSDQRVFADIEVLDSVRGLGPGAGVAVTASVSGPPVDPRRIVEAPTRWPSVSSSPWILMYPQLGFSRAIRTTNAASTSSIGGRPVRFE